MFSPRIAACVAIALGLSFSGLSNAGGLESHMSVFTVAKAQGKETLQPTEQAEPGSTLEYHLDYSNHTGKSLSGLDIKVPVPASTQYLEHSAKAPVKGLFQVSIDGGKTFQTPPVKVKQRNSQGKLVETVATAEQYTHLRWLPSATLNAKQNWQFSYRVKIR